MGLPVRPDKAIVPVLAHPSSGSVFLGTGFFVDQDGTFLTAKHVFADYGLDRRQEFRIAMHHEGKDEADHTRSKT